MSQQLTVKSRPLLKSEVLMLLDLIEKHKIITSKVTNATNNKLKENAWKSIAKKFSTMTGETRRFEQLRLKWENLKKTARKRSALIRHRRMQGEKMYIPPNECMDRVAAILSATCNRKYSHGNEEMASITQSLQESSDVQSDGEQKDDSISISIGSEEDTKLNLYDFKIIGINGSTGGGDDGSEANCKPNKLLHNSPKSSVNKRPKLSELQAARRDKELAIAAYFRAKAEKVNLESIKLQLEIERLRNNYVK